MMDTIQRIENAINLPPEWDELTIEPFQQRSFLIHNEQWNPCNQRYYIYQKEERFLAGAIVYTLKVNLLTFSKLSLYLPMQVIGVPASVSASGMIGQNNKYQETLLQHILRCEKGLVLGMNMDLDLNLLPGVTMEMLPSILVEHDFDDWPSFMQALRAPYRRRLQNIASDFIDIETTITECQEYTANHHDLYLQIMHHTPSKLEVLSEAYFRNLPASFRLVTSKKENRILCWHVICTQGPRFYFFFGGHDYQYLNEFQSYYNNLRLLLKRAINEGYHWIELGQTAEIPKLKMGGVLVKKNFLLYHQNPLIHKLLNWFKPLITYRVNLPAFHVFKTNLCHENPVHTTETIT